MAHSRTQCEKHTTSVFAFLRFTMNLVWFYFVIDFRVIFFFMKFSNFLNLPESLFTRSKNKSENK